MEWKEKNIYWRSVRFRIFEQLDYYQFEKFNMIKYQKKEAQNSKTEENCI